MKRRQLFKRTALIGASGLISIGAHGWAWRANAQTASPAMSSGTKAAANSPRLIVVLLRGAADGLSVVVPYQEPDYYAARPQIAIAKPGTPTGAIDLDGQFGLHPALQPLMSEWQAGNLAFVHACGSPDPSRSHFQAQIYMENGTPGVGSTADGWLNRLLAQLPGSSATRAVNVGGNIPLIFSGPEAVANLTISGANIDALSLDYPQAQATFDPLYAGNSELARMYQEGRRAREVVLKEVKDEMTKASPSSSQFVNNARYLARLMTGDAATQVGFMELGNWDTHVAQSSLLPQSLEPLGAGLKMLAQELGPVYQNTTIVVMSEFGRTIAENGNGGTDHGHGNVLWLLGGGIRGKQVYGEWPGLSPAAQHESRDLAITTDFRDVLMPLLSQQFGLSTGALAQVFPGHQVQKTLQLL